jgi:AraC-like DNA-binding protein
MSRAVRKARRFYLQLEPDQKGRFTVLCGGWERCAPNYDVNRSRFPHHGVEFVADGEGWLELNGKSHPLHRGVAFAYGPGVPHRMRTHPDRCLVKYFVDFAGSDCVPLLAECGLTPGVCRAVAEPDTAIAAFEQVLAAGLDYGRHVARVTALQAEVLLLRLSDAHQPLDGRLRSRQTFERCRAHLDAHFLELRAVEDVACACHVDPAYLSRLFAMHGGEPPYRYLMRRKMAYAAELLHGGSLIVREVADRLGLDPFQFSRAFKRIHGISPAKFMALYAGASGEERESPRNEQA